MAHIKNASLSLWLDTATDYLWIAVSEGQIVLKEHYAKGHNNHSTTLMPTLDAMLQSLNISAQNLKQIVVGVGPGSYTGSRIGVVVAKTLAHTLKIPLYRISSLALMASSVSHCAVCAAIDARRSAVFAGRFQTKDEPKVLTSERYTTLSTFQHPEDCVLFEGRPNIQRAEVFTHLVTDVHGLTPQYLRQTEAEANHDRQTD